MSSSHFKRTHSYNKVSKKLQLYEQQMDGLAANTIIPFVTSRFSIRPVKGNQNLNVTKAEMSQAFIIKSNRLACKVIFNRLHKCAKICLGKQFIGNLRSISFKQKLKNFLTHHNKSVKQNVLQILQDRSRESKIKQVMALFDFASKKNTLLQISRAFHKILLHTKLEREEQKLKVKSMMQFKQVQQKQQQEQINIKMKSNSCKMNAKEDKSDNWSIYSSTTAQSSPQRLKPDVLVKNTQHFKIWRVDLTYD